MEQGIALNLVVMMFVMMITLVILTITYFAMRRIIFQEIMRQVQTVRKVMTILECPICRYSLVREFKQGDYVGKLCDEYCPRDNNRLIITSIIKE